MAAPATGPIPPVSPMFDPAADPAVPYSRGAAEAEGRRRTWTKDAKGWRLPKRQEAALDRGAEPDRGIEPGSLRGGRGGRPRLDRDRPDREARRAATRRVRRGAAVDRDVPGRGRRPAHRVRPRPLPAAGLEPDADRRVERDRRPVGRARHAAREGPRARFGERPAWPPTARSRSRWRPVDTCFRWPSRTRSSCSATRSKDLRSGRSRTGRIDFGMC